MSKFAAIGLSSTVVVIRWSNPPGYACAIQRQRITLVKSKEVELPIPSYASRFFAHDFIGGIFFALGPSPRTGLMGH